MNFPENGLSHDLKIPKIDDWISYPEYLCGTQKICMDEFSIIWPDPYPGNLPARVKSYSRAAKDDVSKGLSFKKGLCIISFTKQNFDEVMFCICEAF